MTLELIHIPCLTDNYTVLGHETETGETFCIDAPDARPILSTLAEKNWKLTHLFITHHHKDHVQGLDQLKKQFNCKVYGPTKESDKIIGLDELLIEGDTFNFAGHNVSIIETPGHTLGHICYHLPDDRLLFSGDTLFVGGCGRLFEGTPADMWSSLSKLMALPGETTFYCGHEYTLSNVEFAMKLEPNNIDLQTRLHEVREKRAANQPTVPSTIENELKTNPFLRASSQELRANLKLETASDEAVFTQVRHLKDQG